MKLIIPEDIERRLHAYATEVPGEIAGMGSLEVRDDGNMWVTDIAIYEQKVTGGTADLSPEALAKFQTDLIKAGKSPKNWYLWWHSHSTMAAFFSGTDTGTIDSSTEFDQVVSLVVNKRRERKCRLDTHRVNGIEMRLKLENIPIEVPQSVNPEVQEIDSIIANLQDEIALARARRTNIASSISGTVLDAIKAEIAEKVTEKVWAQPIGFQQGVHGSLKPYKGDISFLDEDYDDTWPRKKKKDGTVTTRQGRIDESEILLNIETLQTMIKSHEAHGNGDTQECEELRDELDGWYRFVQRQLDDEALTRDIAGLEDEYELFWNGKKYVTREEMDLDDIGMPRLLAPYQPIDPHDE